MAVMQVVSPPAGDNMGINTGIETNEQW